MPTTYTVAIVAKFRVTISRPVSSTVENPFRRIHISLNDKTTMHCRTWEFEARDEKEVRKLFAEAQEMKLPNVHGYRLDKIERLADGDGG